MRTTITLDDQLFRAAKRLAARRDTSLSSVMQEALRTYLAQLSAPRGEQHFTLVTFRGSGPLPGVEPSYRMSS